MKLDVASSASGPFEGRLYWRFRPPVTMATPRQTESATILLSLEAVGRERTHRTAQPELAQRVLALKAYQQSRFLHTYADLLADARHAAAARFFLDELYGPGDFSQRDMQFARIVPAVVRLFPPEIVQTVAKLAELHALSESLDTAMGAGLDSTAVDAASYVRAWQACGRAPDRERQVALTIAIGEALDLHTRRPMMTMSLRMMRAPARSAGLGDLQRFLEEGFETFKAMRGAERFLQTIAERERAFAARLFETNSTATCSSGQFP